MITIVTKSYCPFCQRAKTFLKELWKEYKEIEVSSDEETYNTYKEISGMNTVPQVFLWEPSRDTLIWGYDDMIEKYKAGEIFSQ